MASQDRCLQQRDAAQVFMKVSAVLMVEQWEHVSGVVTEVLDSLALAVALLQRQK